MFSLAQPAWSMEGVEELSKQGDRKRKKPDHSTIDPDQDKGEEKAKVKEKLNKRQKGDESNEEELPARNLSINDYSIIMAHYHKCTEALLEMQKNHPFLCEISGLSRAYEFIEERKEEFIEKNQAMIPSYDELPAELKTKIMEYLSDEEAAPLARTGKIFYALYKMRNERPEKLFAYVKRRVKPENKDFENVDMKKFLDQVSARNPDSIMLTLKALINWRDDVETEWAPSRRELIEKSLEDGSHYYYPDKLGLGRIIDRYYSQLDSSDPYQVAFRFKHKDWFFFEVDHSFLISVLEGCKGPEENPLLFYKLGPLVMVRAPQGQPIRDELAETELARYVIALYKWMNNFKSEAEEVFNIRQRMKLMFFASFLQRGVESPTLSHIESLLEAHTPGNSTPHELYKSHVLAVKLADTLYWDSKCDERVLGLLSHIDQSAQKTLTTSWIPADLQLCLYYNFDNRESGFSRCLRDKTQQPVFGKNDYKAAFFCRRTMEKKDDSQKIPFNLEKYADITYSFMFTPHSTRYLQMPDYIRRNVMRPELVYHASWLHKHVPEYQDQNQEFHVKVAEMYYNGQNTHLDYKRAAQLFQLAANAGVPRASNSLGWMYEKGQGVDQDFGLAFHWYNQAADQGHGFGLCNTAFCYQKGWGVVQDQKMANEMFNGVDSEILSQWKKARGTE